jgi:beta-phosphoglucomutase-like phosphatase (HAD superfamily)
MSSRRLATAPERCRVIEDSPMGIDIGVAARGAALGIADMRELATAIVKFG